MAVSDLSSPPKEHVGFWFDPACPWAWLTSRWLLEVRRVRPLEISWHLMSLAVLHEGRDLPSERAELLQLTWAPLRVLVAAVESHGREVTLPLYFALATRIHLQGRVDMALIAEAIAEVNLPHTLMDAVESTDFDGAIRHSHREGVEPVGDDIGTPIVHYRGAAFFGPVVNPVPTGEDAGRLWDGIQLLAATPAFSELKRARLTPPILE